MAKKLRNPGMGAVSVGQERLDAALDKLCAAKAVQTRLVKAPRLCWYRL